MSMTSYVENIVIGKIEIKEEDLFAYSTDDWLYNEYAKTYFTNERFLPKILVEIGIYPSISEIRRNKPELMIKLDKKDFISKLKVAKKRYLWIAVGETSNNEPCQYGIQQNTIPNAHNTQEVLHGAFDAELHKRTFINYLEVVISPEGVVEYAVPSHSEKLLQVYMQKFSIDRGTALRNLASKGGGYIESLSEVTGYISVWNEAYITGCKPTQQQLNKLKTLKLQGLYRGRIDDIYIPRDKKC